MTKDDSVAKGSCSLSSSSSLLTEPRLGSTWATRISYLFARLACGDDLTTLIRQIRVQLQTSSEEATTTHSLSIQSGTTSGLSGDRERQDLVSPSQKSSLSGTHTILPDDEVWLQRAARVSLFFSVESDCAQDEATKLLYERPVAQAMQREEENLIENRKHTEFVPALPETVHLLSERVAVNYARRWAREGRWDWGLQLLARVPKTAVTSAVAVELHSHTGEWERAMQCLHHVPTAKWTEVEVAAAIRCLYRVSRGQQYGKSAGSACGPTQKLWPQALQILEMCHSHKVRLSTPSAVNDTLALLAVEGPGLEAQTSRVVESMLLKDTGGVVQPNSISVYHMCRAMQRQWHTALRYVAAMKEQGEVNIAEDREATERLLRVCLTGGRWVEAAQTLQKRFEYYANNQHAPSKDDCINVNVFVDVLRLLNDSKKINVASQVLQNSRLSKYFSKDAESKSYNIMLRSTSSVSQAKPWLQKINAEHVSVENESYEHLITLYAKEGQWRKALDSLTLLLDDPLRRLLYIPSAKAHDAVQYALERAPLNGPSWEVSLCLFARMSESHVPISEVAFQSVVKKCFAHGRSEQAQSLFQFVMRRGIHR